MTHSQRYKMKKLYGIGPDEYNVLLEAQNYQCKICAVPSTNDARLVVDHDHKTGRVRGLLCTCCNPLLGFAKDNTEILRKAALYLES
jgi:Recombination endonuclease VII